MTKQLVYLLYAVDPTEEEILSTDAYETWQGRNEYEADYKMFRTKHAREAEAREHNIDMARQYLALLRESFPNTEFTMPWLADKRDANVERDGAVAERCDAIVMLGTRMSSSIFSVYKTAQRFAWNPSTFKAYDLINRGIYFVIASPKPYESFDDFMARLKEAEQRGVDP